MAVTLRLRPPRHNSRHNNHNKDNQTMEIAAGGGNDRVLSFTVYVPDKVEVKVGHKSVNWYNPTDVGEPHTVTFVLDNSTMAGVVSPLFISNTTKFASIPPNSNKRTNSITRPKRHQHHHCLKRKNIQSSCD